MTALLCKRTHNYFEFLTRFKMRVLRDHRKHVVPDIIAKLGVEFAGD
jgi:hypothetical protein